MTIKTVTFVKNYRYDGNEKIDIGYKLLEEFWDTKKYKSLNPGDLYKYGYAGREEIVEMVSADDFEAELEVTSIGGKTVTLRDNSKHISYPMFLTDFASMALETTISKGFVKGIFEFVKKNSKFAIKFVSEDSQISLD